MSDKKAHHLSVGELGESLACRFLENKGYLIIDRNWRTWWGEIDVVAKRKDKVLFVEVKTSAQDSLDDFEKNDYRPEEKIDERKIKRLYRTIEMYCSKHEVDSFDVVAVVVLLGEKDKKARIKMMGF